MDRQFKCRKGYEVQVCRSGAGYYLGTLDEYGCPNCRLTSQYARTAKEAEQLPLDRGYAIEIKACCGNQI